MSGHKISKTKVECLFTRTPASTEPQPLAATAAGLAYFSVHNRAFMSKTCLLYLYSRLCLGKKKHSWMMSSSALCISIPLSYCNCYWNVLTISAINPSSGFGSLSSKPILVKTVAILSDGCQAPCATSSSMTKTAVITNKSFWNFN